MEFKDVLKHEIEQRKVAPDYHNNNLVAEVNHFIADDRQKGMLTDLEWLESIADIVNKRKMSWGTTDCATGLTYKR
jgi:hypothetical protein